MKQTNKLALILSMAGLDGTVTLAALAGLFTLENVLLISILFIAGPGAIITAVLFEGSIRDRMIAALIAGLIATVIVVFAAGIGPKFLETFNLDVLKIAGGISVLLIGFLIMGIKIPEKVPLIIMLVGLIISFMMR